MKFKFLCLPSITLIFFLVLMPFKPNQNVPQPPIQSAAVLPPYAPGQLVVGLMDGYTADMLELPQNTMLSDEESDLHALNAVIVNVPVGQEETYRNLLAATTGGTLCRS